MGTKIPSLVHELRRLKGTTDEPKSAAAVFEWCMSTTIFRGMTHKQCQRAFRLSRRLAAVNK